MMMSRQPFLSLPLPLLSLAQAHSPWSYLPSLSLPSPLSDMSANILNDQIVLTGGCNATNGNVFLEDPEFGEYFACLSLTDKVIGVTPIRDSATGGWEGSRVEEWKEMPRKRARHASSVVKTGTVEVLCVFGGRDEMDGMVAEVDCYDPTTNSWTTPITLTDQYLTSDCAAVTFGDSQVYLMGGYDANYTALDHVTILDMANLSNIQITEGPILRTKRGDVDAEVIGSSIYISGGFTHENDYASPHNSVERLEVSATNGNFQWTEADDLGQERGDKQLVTVDGKLYALGGETKVDVAGIPQEELPTLGEKSTILDTVEVLDVSAEGNEGAIWKPVDEMPAGLFRFAASAWEGSDGEPVIFVFGGQIGYNADCECFATTDKVMVLELDHATLGGHDHDHDNEDDKINGVVVTDIIGTGSLAVALLSFILMLAV
eukprot:CAMPEP_0171422604 /NCGR_PEP_ID=MMETSP0881-20121228/1389_1 /TAXON_ID=67004 /ORGANISM="Thalassiosira weissflogii, Strain CCMP1336" /LENGTH=431 /DNA_ID=CAMNT_0011941271 /DNA_START=27 /DNA_END=1322 /DNA_ORIENTATION=-